MRISDWRSDVCSSDLALAALVDVHGQYAPEDAEVLCVLGGDGFMLQTLHRYGHLHRPVFGMKLGTVGFLMNHYRADDLPERLVAAEPAVLRPLEMTAITESGSSVSLLAYNEVSLLRQTRSEEHTSELQSLMRSSYAVFCLKKKKTNTTQIDP